MLDVDNARYYDGSRNTQPDADEEDDMLDTQHDMPAVIIDDDDEDFILDTNDLFDDTGGLTADAYEMLADMDASGRFIW